MDKSSAIILTLLGLFGVISIIVLVNWLEKKAIRKQSVWSSTRGTVTSSESVFKEGNPTGETGIAINYVVTKIHFSYRIGDKVYSGEQEWTDSGLSQEVLPQADKYPIGTDVTVYYNPNNPTEAVIEQAISYSKDKGCQNNLFGAALALSAGLLIIGMIFLITKC